MRQSMFLGTAVDADDAGVVGILIRIGAGSRNSDARRDRRRRRRLAPRGFASTRGGIFAERPRQPDGAVAVRGANFEHAARAAAAQQNAYELCGARLEIEHFSRTVALARV